MATITAHTDKKGKYWEVRWRDRVVGKERKRKVRDKIEAHRLHAFALEREKGVPGYRSQLGAVSVGWVIDAWFKYKYDKLEPKTRQGYASTMNHLEEAFRSRPVLHVTPGDIATLLDSVVKKAGRDQARVLRTILKQSWDYAVANDHAETNVVAQVPVPVLPVERRRTQPEDPKRVDPRLVLSPKAVMTLADTIHRNYRTLILVLGFVGVRISEAAALRVRDIDFNKLTISINKKMSTAPIAHSVTGRTGEDRPPKSHRERTVTMPVWIAEALAKTVKGRKPDDRVFTTVTGRPLNIDNFRAQYFKPACAKLGFHVTPHWLRHSAASFLLQKGVSAERVARQLGHRDSTITLRVYAGFWEEDVDSVRIALEELHEEL